jgi:hypothetical protein
VEPPRRCSPLRDLAAEAKAEEGDSVSRPAQQSRRCVAVTSVLGEASLLAGAVNRCQGDRHGGSHTLDVVPVVPGGTVKPRCAAQEQEEQRQQQPWDEQGGHAVILRKAAM